MTREIRKDEGAIAVEYILLIILVALGILIGGAAFATSVSGKYETVGTSISGTSTAPVTTP